MVDLKAALEKYEIIKLQNHEANVHQDHMTICAFFKTEQEFANHAAKLRDNIYATIPASNIHIN